MDKKNSVTIIIPAYNAEKTISVCIESVINQTITNWSLIIIDDGSIDRTSVIVDEYANKDNRITVFHRKNSGVSASRNYGISKVETEYFVCVDSDDKILPNYLEELLKAKDIYPNIQNIWSSYQIVKNQEDRQGSCNILSNDSIYSIYSKKELLELYKNWMLQMPWHKLYSTSIVRNNGIKMKDNISLGEDLLFNLEYLDNTDYDEIVVINKVTYNYVRNSKDSLDHKYRKDLLEIYNILDRKLEQYIDKWDVRYREIFDNSRFYHFENIMNNTFHIDNKDNFIKKIKFNNKILRSEEFCRVYGRKTCKVNRYFDLAYRSRNYILVLLVKYIVKKIRKK